MGYRYLRDLSVGPALLPTLNALDWPPDVEICDLHFGPIHMVHWFEERPNHFDRVVFVAAEVRGRECGSIYSYRWQQELPAADEIQQRVGEGVSGVISLDNLLILGQYFKVLPEDVIVVEVEPEDTGWGDGFSPLVEASVGSVVATIRRAVLEGKTSATQANTEA